MRSKQDATWRRGMVVMLLAASGLSLSVPASGVLSRGLSFGVLPYKTPQRLLSDLAPLTDAFNQSTSRPVSIQTAKNYSEFLQRTRSESFDILLTAPHFARLAETESHYQPIAMTGYQVQAVLLVSKNAKIKSVADLQGKVIAMPQREAMIHHLGLALLRAHGLEAGRNVVLQEAMSNQLAMAAPLRGEADASIGGMLLWQTSGLQQDMRVLAASKNTPGMILMVHSRVPQLTIQALRRAVLEFGNTPQGAVYLKTSGHESWVPVTPGLMRSLDSYARAIPR